jgi:hypothetical protein
LWLLLLLLRVLLLLLLLHRDIKWLRYGLLLRLAGAGRPVIEG